MKCDACGTQSDFDAAFLRDPRSRFSPRMLCPSCWVGRNQKRQRRFLLFVLAAGLMGLVLNLVAPEFLLGEFLRNFFLITLFLVLSIVPHELGHVLVGRAVGWRVHQVVIGVGKPLFKRRWQGILFDVRALPVAGATWLTPTDTRWFRIKRCLTILAGPAVNAAIIAVVLVASGALVGTYNFDNLPAGPRLLIWANLCILVVNLWPYQSKSGFALPTDGKQILQTLAFTKKAMQEVQALRFVFEALACRERCDTTAARAWCDRGLALCPDNSHLLNLSAITSLDEEDYEGARQVLLKLLGKDKQPASLRFVLLNNLAYADALSENSLFLAEADAYSRDAFTALPWVPAVVGTRGTVLVWLGKYEEGTRLLTQSIADADSPRSKAENCCHMTQALARMGNRVEALKYLDLARQLDPKCPLLPRAERKLSASGFEAPGGPVPPVISDIVID